MRLASLPLILLLGSNYATSNDQAVLHETTDSTCHNACTALQSSLGSLVHLNPQPPSHASKFYAKQQQELIPACVFTPSSPQDLSTGFGIIKSYGCQFAVRSGGHGAPTGWSNADGGVSIDLGGFNEVELLESEGECEGNQGVVRVGTGARWGDVYGVLLPLGISPVGGRNADVGVGGFILGGGISYISRRYGWAIDNVKNFEVVLANGTIANINRESSPDLFWALRGGGNNFGIVTRFDLETYLQGPAWGGFNFHLMSYADVSSRRALLNLSPPSAPYTLQSVIDKTVGLIWRTACLLGYCVPVDTLFETFQNSSLALGNDPYAHMIMAFVYAADVNLYLGGSVTQYTKETGGPEVYKNFSVLPKIYSSVRNGSLNEFALEDTSYNKPGTRSLWITSTSRLNATLISRIYDIFLAEIGLIRSVKGGGIGLNFQPITLEIVRHFGKNGGNPLGLHEEEEPLMIIGHVLQWKNVEDDALMHRVAHTILERGVEEAKKMGLHHPYIYHNYAGAGQDVFAGYGVRNRQRLMEIQRRYDPDGVFTRLQPGGFKVQDLQAHPDLEE